MVDIAATLIHWYAENKRELPWRETTDPYRIWISEIILQQTRVVQGLEYFNRFMLRFPDVRALAEAPGDEVMKYWQGLGYYSRARNLHAAAKEIVEKFGGEFPRNYSDVLTLKGIGEYTAAICSFAWKLPYAVVDGNVYRVLARIFGIDTPIDSNAGKKVFSGLAAELLDRRHPDLYNQAIMDFGAIQCTPKVPVCLYCPLRENCVALASGQVEKLPVKAGKSVVKPRYFNYLHIHCRGVNLLARRERYLAKFVRISVDRNRAGNRIGGIATNPGLSGIDARGRRNTDTPKFHHAQTCTFTPHYLRPFL